MWDAHDYDHPAIHKPDPRAGWGVSASARTPLVGTARAVWRYLPMVAGFNMGVLGMRLAEGKTVPTDRDSGQ